MSIDVAKLTALNKRLGAAATVIQGRQISAAPTDTTPAAVIAALEKITAALTGQKDLPSLLHRLDTVLTGLGVPSASSASSASGKNQDLGHLVTQLEVATATLPGLPQKPAVAATSSSSSSSSSARDPAPAPAAAAAAAKPAASTATSSSSSSSSSSTSTFAAKPATTTVTSSPAKPAATVAVSSSAAASTAKPAAAAAKPAFASASASASAAPVAAAAAIVGGSGPFYSLEELKKPAGSIAGVDYKNREQYLSDADFLNLFKTTKADFVKLAAWKKETEKKKHGLF